MKKLILAIALVLLAAGCAGAAQWCSYPDATPADDQRILVRSCPLGTGPASHVSLADLRTYVGLDFVADPVVAIRSEEGYLSNLVGHFTGALPPCDAGDVATRPDPAAPTTAQVCVCGSAGIWKCAASIDIVGTFTLGPGEDFAIVNTIPRPVFTVTEGWIEVELIKGHPTSNASIELNSGVTLSSVSVVEMVIGGSPNHRFLGPYAEQRSTDGRTIRHYGAKNTPSTCSGSLAGSTYYDVTPPGAECICDPSGAWYVASGGGSCS